MNDSRALAAVGIGAGLGMLALAAATRSRIVQRVDDAVERRVRPLRPRHAVLRGKSEPAFPSGHTADATAVLATGAYLLVREELAPSAAVAPVVAGLALSVGASRVALGWHWTSDVVGGWLTGIAVASGCAIVYERLR